MSNKVSIKDLAENLSRKEYVNEGGVAEIRSASINQDKAGDSSWLNQRLIKTVFNQLKELNFGELSVNFNGETKVFHGKAMTELKAEIVIKDEQFFRYLAFGGSVGAGEAYINGYWTSPDLTKVIQLFATNQSVTDDVEGGLARLTQPLKQMFHWLNKNTQSGSKKNIVAHYDLGNEFFKTFLDPTMMYSAGIFNSENDSMEQASKNKLDRICQRLRLSSNDHVVEIGTGWAGFAVHAAKKYGCRVTTTTISEEQYRYAEALIKQEGLEEKITLLKHDYRKLTGQYDKLVSIEMIEAVGHHYYPVFFQKCSDLLKPNGEMLLQAITIADQRFDSAKRSIDFIKRYIFPGSCIPSVDSISDSVKSDTNMRVLNLEDIGVHYAETLKAWREMFFKNIEQVKSQGFSDAFIRMWEFYLCYCEGGFRERVISDVQFHMVKPLARVPMKLATLNP